MKVKERLECILLIDDSEDDNYFHRLVIEKSGITKKVDVCTSGEEALDYLMGLEVDPYEGRHLPEIIFLDLNMPRMNGWEFLMELSDSEIQLTETVIVMLSTSPNPAEIKKAVDSSALKKFLNKPLKKEHLEEIVAKYFPQLF